MFTRFTIVISTLVFLVGCDGVGSTKESMNAGDPQAVPKGGSNGGSKGGSRGGSTGSANGHTNGQVGLKAPPFGDTPEVNPVPCTFAKGRKQGSVANGEVACFGLRTKTMGAKHFLGGTQDMCGRRAPVIFEREPTESYDESHVDVEPQVGCAVMASVCASTNAIAKKVSYIGTKFVNFDTPVATNSDIAEIIKVYKSFGLNVTERHLKENVDTIWTYECADYPAELREKWPWPDTTVAAKIENPLPCDRSVDKPLAKDEIACYVHGSPGSSNHPLFGLYCSIDYFYPAGAARSPTTGCRMTTPLCSSGKAFAAQANTIGAYGVRDVGTPLNEVASIASSFGTTVFLLQSQGMTLWTYRCE